MNHDATVLGALMSRRSIRAFLPDAVDETLLRQLFDAARRAPSGSNTQPWKVTVLTGESRAALSRKILAVYNDPEADKLHEEEFAYYPVKWEAPFIDRRRELGWSLYGLLGITRDDKARMKAQLGRNFDFFGAPVGVIFTTDRTMEQGSWLDYGMFLQSVMLMARALGLDTCPQAAFNKYHRIIAEHVQLPGNEMVVCGMSIGYADLSQPENALVSKRDEVDEFVRFMT
jgi:nitroreductase